MNLPWAFLYRLVAQNTPVLQRVGRQSLSSDAAASLNATIYTCPGDMAFLLDSVDVRGSAGAAQDVQRIQFEILNPGGNVIVYRKIWWAIGEAPAALPTIFARGWTGCVMVMPGESIRCTAVFNAGGAVNSLECSILGVQIPRGDVQFG